jgi:hypothetical protein
MFGILVVGGLILAKFGLGNRQPDVSPIVVAGGGGDPKGGPGKNTGTGKEEMINQPAPEPEAKATPPKEELVKPEAKPAPILPADKTAIRPIEEIPSSSMSVSRAAQDKLRSAIAAAGNRSKGRGGPGEGGGKGKGVGTGEGDLAGPGKMNVTQREKRQLRWQLNLRTADGLDYLRQLKGLGAILAIDGPNGELLVIEDLSKRPAKPVAKDLSEINRIYWVDDGTSDGRESAYGRRAIDEIARALQLSPPPRRIIAFFPVEFENELLRKELAYRNLPEDEIDATYFKLVPRGRGYEPVVVQQTRKGR